MYSHRGLKTRLLLGGLKAVVLVIALYLLLPWLGLRVTRVARKAVPLVGSELEHSRAASAEPRARGAKPANVIVFVGDGLGFAHLSAARSVLHGMGARTVWDRFTTTGWHQPHSARGFLVDSAASATALATGVPTNRGSVGVDTKGASLPNLFERASALGYRSGVVTDSYIWDATPAAFVTHVSSREDAQSILDQLAESPIEILIGELKTPGEDGVPEREATVEILERRFRVFGPDSQGTEEFLRRGRHGEPTAALLEEDQLTDLRSTPTLPQLLSVALERLSSDERPFLLLVESEEPDSASHQSDFARLMRGMEAIETALGLVLDFADSNGETLVLFVSDHETGGLALSRGDSKASLRALWPSRDHTGVVVPVLAFGPGADDFGGMHSTWEIGRSLGEMLVEPRPAPPRPPAAHQVREPG
jgi:alkaline phosphatase